MTTPVIGEESPLARKDLVSDVDVRWCPGCGDYAILAQMQKVLPDLGIPRENFVFISGKITPATVHLWHTPGYHQNHESAYSPILRFSSPRNTHTF